jgi:hypothetical protein
MMKVLFPAVLCSFVMLGADPAANEFGLGKLIQIVSSPEIPSYEYTLLSGCGYVGTSKTRLRVRQDTEVKFTIQGKSLYIIDEHGKVKRLRYVMQFLPPPPIPPKR